jgi:DNA polymerase III epsilon subunit-like protein
MSYDPSKVIFVDTETLGLQPHHPIWEIAVIVDGEEIVWQQIPPLAHVNRADPEALRINGFHDRYNEEGAVSRGESASRFAYLADGRHIVGSNPAFDSERLAADLRQSWGQDPSWHYRLRDINAMAHGFLCHGIAYHGFEPEPPFSLTDMLPQLGLDYNDFQPSHTALCDARLAKAVYETIVGPPKEPT